MISGKHWSSPVAVVLAALLFAPATHASIPSAADLALAPRALPELAPASIEATTDPESCGSFCQRLDVHLEAGLFGGGGASVVALDAWGNYRNPQELEASKNRFGFTGHLFDRETGTYYAKARYFDPGLGRFLTQDSYLGEIDNPPSLHRYSYAHNRPMYFVDPTGHCTTAASVANFQDCFTAALTGIVAPPANFLANWGSALLYNATGSERFRARGEAFQGQKEAVDTALQSPAHLLTATAEGFTGSLSSISENINEGRGREAAEGFGGYLAQAPVMAESAGVMRVTPAAALVTAEGRVVQTGGTLALRSGPSAAAGILMSGNAKGNEATTAQENTPTKENPSPTVQVPATQAPQPPGSRPRGSNNPATRAAVRTGQEAHRQIEAELKAQGYETEVTIKLEEGMTVRKDAVKGAETVIIKPDTPTGTTAAQARAKLMQEHGYDPTVKLYDPQDPRYQPGSSTYIGPKKKER